MIPRIDAQHIIDANSYLTLATTNASGAPLASPVWFGVSESEARHSRNLAERPECAIVIFDSTVAGGDRRAPA